MSLSLVPSPQGHGHVSQLPDDVLAAKVFPFLMDVDDPRSLAAIHRVCKQWHAIMNDNLPYAARIREPHFFENYPRMALHRIQAQSAKELYVGYYPKTFKERVELAYNIARLNTSDFEAETLSRFVVSHPIVGDRIFRALGGYAYSSLLAMANLPSSITLPNLRAITLNRIGVGALSGALVSLGLECFLVMYIEGIPFEGVQQPDPVCAPITNLEIIRAVRYAAMLSAWVFLGSFFSLTTHPEGTYLGEFYRKAKGSIAAMVPIGKKVISCVKSTVGYLSKYVPSVFRKREVEVSFPKQLFTTQSSPSLP